ncbi:hypothetical protein BU16DRAFT_26522 [Lophium mytilinum]|uniref:Rhodopsin domain-containing protein n=1 Tax=Lophium mytilinum TaxID=390894 RepID=A0A6A6RHS9_9PEZI|nr:hypothetical protein BU16DRAFT_26522 [Lophium mytilinum]
MASPFTPEKLAWLELHKNDSRATAINWAYSVPIPVSIITTALRLWAKKAGRNGITLDDYLITFATICLVGECASGLGYGPPHGMGRHVTAVSAYDLMTFRKGDYVLSHFYDIALATVKLAILAFYYRVFVQPIFRRVVLGTAAFVLSWGIGITVAWAVFCIPINAYWDDRVKGKCLNIDTFTYFTNISNLVTDIWVFLLPVPVILRLQLPRNKKIALCFIFSIGLATCVVSCLRLRVVLNHGDPDFTWAAVPLGAYSVYEPLGGILCNNLPIIYHMVRKLRKEEASSKTKPTEQSSSRPSRFTVPSISLSGRPVLGDESPNRWLPLPPSTSQEELTTDGLGLAREGITQAKPAEFWNKVETQEREKDMDEEGAMGSPPPNTIVVEREFKTEVQMRRESGDGQGRWRKNVYEMKRR